MQDQDSEITDNGDASQVDVPAVVEVPQPVVATLYLPKAKGNRSVKVYGKSGTKYGFKMCPKANRPVRVYTSQAQFEREELDIRSAIGQPHIVCTLMGTADIPGRAVEGVRSLVEARLQVPAGKRLRVLHAIRVIAKEAIAELEENGVKVDPEGNTENEVGGVPTDEGTESQTPVTEAAETPPQPPPVVRENTPPDGAIVASPIPLPAPKVELKKEEVPVSSRTVPYTEVELMEMPFDQLRAMAKEMEVKGNSRKELVTGVLEKQKK